jgi:hypothetical protein
MSDLWTDNGYYNLEAVKDGSVWEGEMKWSEWFDKYKPINNHLDKYAHDESYMFETYGPELEFVQATQPEKVWTLIEGDCSTLILAGYHYVNRLGYYVCEEPWETGDEQVLLSVEVECECYDEEAYAFTLPNGVEIWESGNPDCDKGCEGAGYRTEYLD